MRKLHPTLPGIASFIVTVLAILGHGALAGAAPFA